MNEVSRHRERLRRLVTQRLGLSSTVLQDFRIDIALEQLTERSIGNLLSS